jgi:hypothetical protein
VRGLSGRRRRPSVDSRDRRDFALCVEFDGSIVHACVEAVEERRMNGDVNADGEDTRAERAEVHFLAALADELMRALLLAGVLSQAQLNEIEAAVAARVGSPPRAW